MSTEVKTTGDLFTYNEMNILKDDFIDPIDTPEKSLEQIEKKIKEYSETLDFLRQMKERLEPQIEIKR